MHLLLKPVTKALKNPYIYIHKLMNNSILKGKKNSMHIIRYE